MRETENPSSYPSPCPCFGFPPYLKVWVTFMAWSIHAVLLSVILRTMSLPASIPWVEVFAYTGYTYVPACITLVAGILGGEGVREGGSNSSVPR